MTRKTMTMKHSLEECTLCPRECHANRLCGEVGYCRQTAQVRAARAALHMWEEPCISGNVGSGTVFFTGCTLGCVYCQNALISDGDVGKEISTDWLARIFLELQEQGAWNINLVTAGHFAPQVARALEIAKSRGLTLPVVYNTSGYEKVETLKFLEGYIDVYLPDLKYMRPETAYRLSGVQNYPEIARAAINEMFRQVGKPVFAGEQMLRGVIVRHLVLPGMVEEAKAVIRYLYDTYGDNIYISILNQYTPTPRMSEYPDLNRKITRAEYDAAVDFAIDLGVENGFIQEGDTAKESFIPEFDITGIDG